MGALNWINGTEERDLEAEEVAAEKRYAEEAKSPAGQLAREGNEYEVEASEALPTFTVETPVGGAKLSDGAKAMRFMLAGNARVTLVSVKTGTRFTYRVREKKTSNGALYFVSVLTGSNNESDYEYLGTIFANDHRYAHGKKSRIAPTAPSAAAFKWACKYLLVGELPPSCEVHHEGRCGKCNKTLTVPESIETGLGPVCAGKE